MKPKYVKLVIAYGNNLGYAPKVGSIYKVTNESPAHYELEGFGSMGWAPYRFRIVGGCPCSVKSCIAKHT